MKNKNIIYISIIIVLLIALIGISFAYFTANVSGGESSTTISATSGEMTITFTNGSGVITANNIIPSSNAFANKNFTVTGNNSTDDDMFYELNLIVENNTFTDRAISYSLSSTNTSNNGTIVSSINNTGIYQGSSSIHLGNGYFVNGYNKVHTYILNIYFLDNGKDQSTDMNKSFKAHVEINSIETPEISFTIDGITYNAKFGMKWSYWLNSSFNTGGFSSNSSSSLVVHNNSEVLQHCVASSCTDVKVTDQIIDGATYMLDV